MTETYTSNEPTARKCQKLFNRVCKACEEAFQSVRVEAEFCGDKCRKAYHNLAMVRGRDLYPLVMAWRDQSAANTEERKAAMSAICRLVAVYREEDAAERKGIKKSFDSVREVKQRLAHIFSARVVGHLRPGR
jgi:hypothetical protein